MSLLMVETKNFEISEGFLYALIGFVLVLVVLVVLMGFIYLLSFVVRKFDDRKKGEKVPASTEAPAPALAPGSSGSVKLYNVDDRTAAMLMAIVADELKTPLNELRFVSVREVTEEDK